MRTRIASSSHSAAAATTRSALFILIHKYAHIRRLQNVECDLHFEHLFYCNEVPFISMCVGHKFECITFEIKFSLI